MSPQWQPSTAEYAGADNGNVSYASLLYLMCSVGTLLALLWRLFSIPIFYYKLARKKRVYRTRFLEYTSRSTEPVHGTYKGRMKNSGETITTTMFFTFGNVENRLVYTITGFGEYPSSSSWDGREVFRITEGQRAPNGHAYWLTSSTYTDAEGKRRDRIAANFGQFQADHSLRTGIFFDSTGADTEVEGFKLVLNDMEEEKGVAKPDNYGSVDSSDPHPLTSPFNP